MYLNRYCYPYIYIISFSSYFFLSCIHRIQYTQCCGSGAARAWTFSLWKLLNEKKFKTRVRFEWILKKPEPELTKKWNGSATLLILPRNNVTYHTFKTYPHFHYLLLFYFLKTFVLYNTEIVLSNQSFKNFFAVKMV